MDHDGKRLINSEPTQDGAADATALKIGHPRGLLRQMSYSWLQLVVAIFSWYLEATRPRLALQHDKQHACVTLPEACMMGVLEDLAPTSLPMLIPQVRKGCVPATVHVDGPTTLGHCPTGPCWRDKTGERLTVCLSRHGTMDAEPTWAKMATTLIKRCILSDKCRPAHTHTHYYPYYYYYYYYGNMCECTLRSKTWSDKRCPTFCMPTGLPINALAVSPCPCCSSHPGQEQCHGCCNHRCSFGMMTGATLE